MSDPNVIGEICLTVVTLAEIGAHWSHRMKVADRERLAAPQKQQQEDTAAAARDLRGAA